MPDTNKEKSKPTSGAPEPWALPAHCWARLERAAKHRSDPWRTLVLASSSGAGPAMRTVVLRSCLARERMISCHTDRRSAKFRDLAADPRVALLFYDTQTREQLRCEATAHCHQDDEVAADAWATLAAASRAPYAQRLAPGSGLQHAIDNGNTAHQEPLCDELAQQQFVVIRCTVHRMDWLQLNPGGHERALMLWHGSAWHSERTAP